MSEPTHTPERLVGGALRFSGHEAMVDVFRLVSGDPDYSYGLAPWPYAWIDVRPHTFEARALLLEVVGGAGEA